MIRAIYRSLIGIHPPEFREQFAEEMLWIFDECNRREHLDLLTDGFTSLVRQWTLRSGLWKLGAAAMVSALLILSCAYSLQASLDAALRRGNPEYFREAQLRLLAKQKAGPDLPSGPQMATQAGTTSAEIVKDAQAVDAIQGIVAALKAHPLVAIGEDHWLLQPGEFYVQLIRSKDFQETVQDIVVEFASRNNQAMLDKYVSGADVPQSDVKRIWRDTTKVASWESPIYANWLAVIRQVNQGLPPSHRLRVLAGDTSIEWSQIHTHDEWAALGDNNVSFADVITKEVLAKNHHALVVLGAGHLTKGDERGETGNVTARIESHYPGSTFVVLLDYWGLLTPEAQNEIDAFRPSVPAVYVLAGTTLGKTVDGRGAPVSKHADALLYLGPPTSFTMAFPAPGSLDPAYLTEIDRRSMIEWGELRARKFLGPAAH
jgi:hypothetical protein